MGRRPLPRPSKVKWTVQKGNGLAAQLAARFKSRVRGKADRSRINVVSPSLCDDAIKRLESSLTAYQGCDIIDLNPGNCLWSWKIHQTLRPRWHALVEPDVGMYKTYLDEIIGHAPSAFTHVPTSPYERGFWPKFLEDYGAKMKSMAQPSIERGINRSLLVLANLGTLSQKAKGFQGPLPPFYIQNFIEAMYERAHVHSHGYVKMLAWMWNEHTYGLAPRTVAMRTKFTTILDAAVAPKYVVGTDRTDIRWRNRRHWPIDEADHQRILNHMHQSQAYYPAHRQQLQLGPHPVSFPNTPDGRVAMSKSPNYDPFFGELIERETAAERGHIQKYSNPRVDRTKRRQATEEWKALMQLRNRHALRHKQYHDIEKLVDQRLAIDDEEEALRCTSESDETQAWTELASKIENWKANRLVNRTTSKEKIFKDVDDWRAFKTSPPVLSWDQREIDPLRPNAEEFIPNEIMTLVDLEPRPDLLDLIDTPEKHTCLRYLGQFVGASGTRSVSELLDIIAPGAGAYLATKVPSLTDPAKGGSRFLSDVRLRTFSAQTLIEMALALEKFPLRPQMSDMRAQMQNTDRRRQARDTVPD